MEVRQCPIKYCCYCGNESNLKLHLERYHHLPSDQAERLARATMEEPIEEVEL
ncbi:hypothetical protein ES708_14457 [subsurface metagenome]